ncbi:MAG: hypothetical protein IJU69_04380, partial [Bacteroidales bacterium]|nr:hypothetical protein [Bacteroidales bacterium]
IAKSRRYGSGLLKERLAASLPLIHKRRNAEALKLRVEDTPGHAPERMPAATPRVNEIESPSIPATPFITALFFAK